MAKLGKYELLRPLASGGMAELYLARQSGLGGFQKTVVVKWLHPQFATDDTVVKMFVDEARIAARLNHTNIVQIYDLGEANGDYFIAMEYVAGRNLREIQAREKELGRYMPYGLVAYVISRMCRGLYHAHVFKDESDRPLEIVHRDVSPQNVLLSFEGEVKLADFGIAKAASRAAETQAGILKGKVAYMSPEQVEGKPVDARSDIFSAGILLYELTCRRRLFRRNSDFATMRAVIKDPIPPPSAVMEDVPDEIEMIITRALARDPAQRYPDAQQMHQELEHAIRANGWTVGASEAAEFMVEMFGGDGWEEETVRIPADEDPLTGAERGDPTPSAETSPSMPSHRAFIEAPTVITPEQGRSGFAKDLGDDPPTTPHGQVRRPPAARFPVEPATVIGPPSFDDIQDDGVEQTSPGIPAHLEEVPTSPSIEEVHVQSSALSAPAPATTTPDPPGPPPAPPAIPPRPPARPAGPPPSSPRAGQALRATSSGPSTIPDSPPAGMNPLEAVAPPAHPPASPGVPDSPAGAAPDPPPVTPPAPPARTAAQTAQLPRTGDMLAGGLEPMPTVAAIPAPPARRLPPKLLLGLSIVVLLGALTVLVVHLWRRGVIGPRRLAVVQVTSKPAGATVYLDGEKRFGVTPLSLHGVMLEQAHMLVVALDGYEPWRLRLVLNRDQFERHVIADLRPVGRGGAPGMLVVKADQPGAQVFLDGELKGTAPITIDRVKSGEAHTLVVKKDGFDDEVIQIDALRPQEKRPVWVKLTPAGKKPLNKKGVERPKRKGDAPAAPVVLPSRATVPPLREGNVGERVPGK